MLGEISVQEFREWRAYYDLEPFGEERQDLRIASIVSTMVNLVRKKGKPPIKIRDAMLRIGEPPAKKRRPWEQLKAMGAAIAGAFQRGK